MYSVILFNHKKILPFGTMWIDSEGFFLSEIGWTGKENYIFFFTFIWNLFVYFHSYEEYKKKKKARNSLKDTENKLLPEGKVEE